MDEHIMVHDNGVYSTNSTDKEIRALVEQINRYSELKAFGDCHMESFLSGMHMMADIVKAHKQGSKRFDL